MQFLKVNKFSEKTVNIRAGGTILALASLLFVFWSSPAHAVLVDDFESYSSNSNLETATGNVWYYSDGLSDSWRINSTQNYQGTRSLYCDGSGAGACSQGAFTSTDQSMTHIVHTFYVKMSVVKDFAVHFCQWTAGVCSSETIGLTISSTGSVYPHAEVSGIPALDSQYDIQANVWYRMQVEIDFVEFKARVRYDTSTVSTPWSDWDDGDESIFVDTIRTTASDANGWTSVDDWGSVSGIATSSSSGGREGETRLIRHDPAMGETLASTTDGYLQNATYFVADGVNTSFGTTRVDKNDFCNGISILRICTTKIQLNVKRADSSYVNVYAEEVPDSGEQYIQHFKSNINAPGTYQYEVRIYNAYIGSRWAPELNEEILFETGKFYVGSPTPQEDLDEYWGRTPLEERNEIIDENSIDPGTISSPGLIPRMFSNVYDQFMHLPPWGYAVVFNETLQSGTSTELGTLTMSFATSSVAHGKTLELPITDGFSNAITLINANGVTGPYGNQFATFLHYWELLWYIIFAMWIGKEVLGIWGGTNLEDSHTLDLQNSRDGGKYRDRHSEDSRNTLDLRRKK